MNFQVSFQKLSNQKSSQNIVTAESSQHYFEMNTN